MLDYHLHLWPHSESSTPLNLDQIAAYCAKAKDAGVVEVALTEHLFRFTQATSVVGGFWNDDDSEELARSMQEYWEFHARADLDAYVDLALDAKRAGLPVVLGLEVDYYRGHMDKVADLLSGYPFDVLLGSVHWIGSWRFDVLEDPVSMNEWSARDVDSCWDAYTEAIEELAASKTCDVMAHPDLIKIAGHRPRRPDEWWDRIAESAAGAGIAAELSSAGWATPAEEQYPAVDLLARFAARGVPFTTASDAHGVTRVADRAVEMRSILASVGVDHVLGFRRRQSHRISIAANSKGD
ncbi:MAG: PHP domain-containing protein [Actinobacteria bacterium]|nr:PHP domain-containing protein [Actinomycetota bacterium]MCL5445224.1 PHP domain-containing protein [Actinomycetota bacterium]